LPWKRELELRAGSRSVLSQHALAVPVHDALRQREADAGAEKFVCVVQSLEPIEL
jgi:hypothetical protein